MKAATGAGAPSFQTTVSVDLEALDGAGKKAWDVRKEYPFSLSKEELDKLLDRTFAIELESEPLAPGAYVLNLTLSNALDGGKIHRKAKITVGARVLGTVHSISRSPQKMLQ